MGCVSSTKKLDADNVFKVVESRFGEGKLKINSKEMIFYQKGCDKKTAVIQFSLKHLRRYGVDMETNIFCFEAGRSCMTGEGIYPFKITLSQNASAMFDILKNYIEGIDSSTTNEDVLFMNNMGGGLDHLDETLNSLRTQRAQSDGYEPTDTDHRISSHRKAFQIRMSSVSGASPQTIESSDTPFLYENQFIENNNSIDVPSSSYVNVTTATTPKSCKSVSFFDETIPRNYENQDIQEVPTEETLTEINYTELELNQENSNKHQTPVKSTNTAAKVPVLIKSFSTGQNVEPLITQQSRNSLPFNYAVIDFERTNALANSTCNSSSTGVRKTRHHSEDNFLFEKRRNVILGV